MKVLVQLRPWVNGVRVDGRKAWVGKDDNNKLIIDTIYKDESTASNLTDYDYISLKSYESQGSFNIIKVIE